MKTKYFATAVILASSFMAQSASAGWIDWTNTSQGTMTIDSTTVGVTMTGNPNALFNGDYYYNNVDTGGVSPTATYAEFEPSDVIQVTSAGSFTLTFDQTVSDLYMALVSVGQGSLPVDYDFNDSYSVVSSGPNYWGYGGYTESGNTFTGKEFNGVLKFEGAFDSIAFDTSPYENWHGFNFASFETTTSRVPEPGSLILLSLGLIGLAASRKRPA